MDCANMTLAIGASPIMANAPEEVFEITSLSNALVLNMGTLSADGVEAMLASARAAREAGLPIIFDPVGVGATTFRRESAQALLDDGKMTIIRGNASEMRTLSGLKGHSKGVDAGDDLEGMERVAETLAEKLGAIVAITGATDLITDGKKVIKLTHGHPLLARVTGTGCMTNSLIAAFAAAGSDALEAAVLGILTMSLAGERAATSLNGQEGLGTFRIRLFDHVGFLAQKLNIGDVSYEESIEKRT